MNDAQLRSPVYITIIVIILIVSLSMQKQQKLEHRPITSTISIYKLTPRFSLDLDGVIVDSVKCNSYKNCSNTLMNLADNYRDNYFCFEGYTDCNNVPESISKHIPYYPFRAYISVCDLHSYGDDDFRGPCIDVMSTQNHNDAISKVCKLMNLVKEDSSICLYRGPIMNHY